MEEKIETIARDFLLKPIILECFFCSGRTTIYVDRKRMLYGTVLWECFDCQKVNKGATTWKAAVGKGCRHLS